MTVIGHGVEIVTSSTRPTSPFDGMQIYETDTKKMLVYNGSAWVEIADLAYSKNYYVFDTEANRDAAIGSPTEGMMAYLTAPTIPAASGEYMMVPSGVLTVYNGSVWVCKTAVGAHTSNTGTTTSNASWTTSLSGTPGTNPKVTLVTGTTARISISCIAYNNISGNASQIGVKVTGASSFDPNANSADYAITRQLSSGQVTLSKTFMYPNLTAGTNTFELGYIVSSGTTGTFSKRDICVEGVV